MLDLYSHRHTLLKEEFCFQRQKALRKLALISILIGWRHLGLIQLL